MREVIDDEIDGIPLVPEPSKNVLAERQQLDYAHHRRDLIEWMLHEGKDPERGDGYAWETARRRATNLDQYCRWVWEENGSYTAHPTLGDADAYNRHLTYSDHSQTHKANLQKTLIMYYRWRAATFSEDEWEPNVTFNASSTYQPQDYLSRKERRAVREAALEYGSVPNYHSVTPPERAEWKQYLAMRLRKPTSEITQADWQRANGYKFPSLVWTSLDAGLRPKEVENARISWVDSQNALLRIPVEDSTKSEDNWTVSLQNRTADALDRWLAERQLYRKYDETDQLWLTRESNSYQSTSLRRLLRKLCDIAGIDYEHRSMTWYSIRRSTATYMAREEGLEAARQQLRHKDIRTTAKYDQAPPEDRRGALERMG